MAQNSKGAYLNVFQDADGKDVYPITRADGVYMNDGTTAQAKCEALDSKIDSTKSALEQNFQAGVDGIYSAITAQGTTPVSKAQGDIKNAIKTLADAKYAAGHKGSAVASDVLAGKTFSNDSSVGIGGSRVDLGSEPEMQGGTLYNGNVYLYPVSGGDNRNYGIQRGVHASPSNIAGWSGGTLFTRSQYDSNYSSGYNQGVTDADNRANSSSTNYKSGYNVGYSAGRGSLKSKDISMPTVNSGTSGNNVSVSANAGVSILGASIVGGYMTTNANSRAHGNFSISWSGNTVTVTINCAPTGWGSDWSFTSMTVRVWYWG